MRKDTWWKNITLSDAAQGLTVHVELFSSARLCLAFCLLSVSNVSPMYNFTTACPQTCVCVRVWALTSPPFSVMLSAHLAKLGKLMQERKKDQAQASVLEFFREFGTHVLPGPILWGGVVR